MHRHRPLALTFVFFGILTWIIPASALAEDRIGKPYRGPVELLSGGGASDSGGDEGGGGEEGGGGDEGGGGGGEEGGGGTTPGGGVGGGGTGSGRVAIVDGNILWQWWWEHNKDRFLAASTEKGRINAGSAYYWFGAGAKFPPRETSPVSDGQRAEKVYPAILGALRDKDSKVRAEACIAMGRLGKVDAKGDDKKAGDKAVNNLVTRALMKALKDSVATVRHSAMLGLGLSGDPQGCEHLMRSLGNGDDRAYAFIALGLARHLPAVGILVDSIPTGRTASNEKIAAIHALGLMGPGAVPELDKGGREGTKALYKIISGSRNKDDAIVTQTVATLGRLQIGREKLTKLAGQKSSKNVAWNVLLALGNYWTNDKDAGACFKELKGKPGYKNGAGQNKVFALLAMGELVRGLDPNSKQRDKILTFLKKDALEKKDNYVRSAACLALGMANDQTARDGIARLLVDRTGSDYTAGAAAIGLGMLRSTDHADAIAKALLQTRKWKDDARGYGALGLAMLGDTTRMDDLMKFKTSTLTPRAERQVPVALGVLGDKDEVRSLVKMFEQDWKKRDNHAVSNSAFGMGWIRDQSAVEQLLGLTRSSNAKVRGMAIVALGYSAARDRVDGLTRCYSNISHRNHYGTWSILEALAQIL